MTRTLAGCPAVTVMGDVSPNQLKRKRTSSVDDDDRTDHQLRRRVFELSLAKVRTAAPLTRSLRRRDPPLLRSVLILNTLRAVNASGVFSAAEPTLSAAAVVAPSTPCRSPSVLDELPGLLLAGDGRPPVPSPLTEDLGPCSPLTDGRPADDATSSSILDDLFGGCSERTSSTTTLVPSPPPVLTFSSLFDLDCASVWPSSSSTSSSSMDVDLDLDVAMFDFDLLQPLTVGCAAGSRSSSSVQAAAAGVLTTSTCTQRNQFVDELEFISEILVGT